MLHDIRLLAWLRIRHARTAATRLMHFAGTDLVESEGVGERVYQLYIAAFFAIALAMLWAALLDAVETTFATLGAAFAISAFHSGILVMVAVFAATGIGALRASPLKCSHPDIAYVVASGMGMPAVALEALAVRIAGSAVVAGLAGYVLGTGLSSGLAGAVEPFAAACFALVGASAAISAAWLAGAVRLALRRRVASVVVGVVVVAAVALASGALAFSVDPVWALAGFGFPVMLGALAMLVLACVVASTVLAASFDRAIVIEENALFADMKPLGAFSAIDPNTVRDYRRRRKLAMRKPRFHLPTGRGRAALTSRAALSLVRQYDGFPTLAMQGLMAAPLGVFALSGEGGLIALLFWLQTMLMFNQGIREETRAFGDDIRVRLVRDRLPFGTLELLVFDTLPSFLIVAALSTVAIVALAPLMHVPLGWAVVLGVCLNALFVLARGFDAIHSPVAGRIVSYEVGLLAIVIGLGIVARLQPIGWVVAAAIALACLFASIVKSGKERL